MKLKDLREALSSRRLALTLLKECKGDSDKALDVLDLLREYFDKVVKNGVLYDNIEQAVHTGLRCSDELNAQSVKFNLFWRMAFEHEQSLKLEKKFDVFPCMAGLFFRHEKHGDFPDALWYKVMFDIRIESEEAGELEYYYPVQTFWGNMLNAIYLPKQDKVLSRLDNWGLFDLQPYQMIWFCNHLMVEDKRPMQWYLNDGHNTVRYRFFKFLTEKGGLKPYSHLMNKMVWIVEDLETFEHQHGFVSDAQIRKQVEWVEKQIAKC